MMGCIHMNSKRLKEIEKKLPILFGFFLFGTGLVICGVNPVACIIGYGFILCLMAVFVIINKVIRFFIN